MRIPAQYLSSVVWIKLALPFIMYKHTDYRAHGMCSEIKVTQTKLREIIEEG
jgi:hypothetical protein